MNNNWSQVSLVPKFTAQDFNCYGLTGCDFLNSYYIISEKASQKLMNHPEVIGLEVYKSLLNSTSQMIKILKTQDKISSANILNILRGGLNFPLEESCYKNNIPVHDISFISSERIFDDDGNISGLAIKYSMINAIENRTLMIGDIIASGETFDKCLRYLVDYYKNKGSRLSNVIVFTIGGTKTIELLENLTKEIRQYWPNFEGFITIFYEGIFSCYEPGDYGVSGINRPLIDFIWRDGIIAPEFRYQTLTLRDALFEKCIIYDGGARRFNIREHIDEVLEFWNGILDRADNIDKQALLEEKLGHKLPISYEDWLTSCHYNKLPEKLTKALYQQENEYIESLKNVSFKQIAQQRISEFTSSLK